MDKDVRYTDNGVLMNHKQEEKPAICNSMDGPWGHSAKWNESGKEKYCNDCPYMWNLKEKQTHRENR